jgi:hypothetical protein
MHPMSRYYTSDMSSEISFAASTPPLARGIPQLLNHFALNAPFTHTGRYGLLAPHNDVL